MLHEILQKKSLMRSLGIPQKNNFVIVKTPMYI